MNKQAIERTAICYFSDEDDCHIVVSPIFQAIAGVGETPKKAWTVFYRLLDAIYLDYLEGKLAGYSKPGRPRKGGTPFNAIVQPDTKKGLSRIAKEFSISQGEVVDYLFFYYQVKRQARTNAINIKAKVRTGKAKETPSSVKE